ncbi:hypothetical protein I7I51_02468 [Histoplasma capsulatum]|uniref:Uncharacterized protein n=1 Tax=Ajellomyces capsulatus TaxID=5037 RepID=A0A8A1M9W3_AJECA|nr:hypothetical protein I7I51_02468 [Histoplasma capsulatum]
MKKAPGERATSDVILPMQDPYMTQITDGRKNYEFRKYCLMPSAKRIWFYRTAPLSSITHVCETKPARTRKPGDRPLDEDGLGNAEFNSKHKDWDGYDFAYEMVTCLRAQTADNPQGDERQTWFQAGSKGACLSAQVN